MVRHLHPASCRGRGSLVLALAFGLVCAQGAESADPVVQALLEQNRLLQAQVQAQQKTIDTLGAQLQTLAQASERHDRELHELEAHGDIAGAAAGGGSLGGAGGAVPAIEAAHAGRAGEIRLSGEAGVAFFRTGSGGMYPNSEFRVDDAKLFVEAQVHKDIYFYGGLDITTREQSDEYFHTGELYVDFENVSGLWGGDRWLNLRAGRCYIPFGEEYQVRNVVDNPLITHSMSDIWGIDEGVELYGSSGAWDYVLAIQNGGHKTLRDYDPDKAVIGRVGYAATSWLRLSASAMRTGNLNVTNDAMSETWFANGFFRSIGGLATTSTFGAELYEADAIAHWHGGQARANVGRAYYHDNDSASDNRRRLTYGSLELVQNISGGLYGAVRASGVAVPRGYPLIGWGDYVSYFVRPNPTDRLDRLSFGFGYRLGPPLVVKLEYAFERGHTTANVDRDYEDVLSTEIALRF